MTQLLNSFCKCHSAKWHSLDCRLYRPNQADDFGAGNEIRHKNGSTGVVVGVWDTWQAQHDSDVIVTRYYDKDTGELGEIVNTPVWDLTNNFSME